MENTEIDIRKERLKDLLNDGYVTSYLNGVFTLIRNIVGYTSSVNDFVNTELKKSTPNIKAITAVLSESDDRMTDLLASIIDAHQLIYNAEEKLPPKVVSLSETVESIAGKISSILLGQVIIKTNIEAGIYAEIQKTSLEIIITDIIDEMMKNPERPSEIEITLSLTGTDDKNALIAVTGTSVTLTNALKNMVFPHSDTAEIMYLPTFQAAFTEQFCKVTGCEIKSDGKHYTITLPCCEAPEPATICSNKVFEFNNIRFSPASVRLRKYSGKKRY
ncbi:MAG: hypothetical protein LBM87_05025 [Ruminococcus sp.]|jgi:hypothetical protein|nr:hypothetical protein [Ruminococcus sp.]